MTYNTENVLQRYENLLRKKGLNIGRRQWGLLERTLNEFVSVGEPVSATQAKNPMDPNLLRSLPEATSKRLPTSVIRRVQDYIVDKNGYREKGQDTLLHRAYNSTPPDEAAFEFYQEYCHPNGTSHYCNTGTKTINLLRAYLRARGLLKE